MYSLIPTSPTSAELLTLIFFYNNFPLMIAYPIDMAPPVWLLMLLCTAYDESIQVNASEKILASITHLSSIVFFTNNKYLFRFFKSYSSLLDTQLFRKDTNGSRYGSDLFIRYNKLATTK